MIIKIDKTNKIVAAYYGETAKKFPADGVTLFEVEDMPSRKPTAALYFDPESNEVLVREMSAEILAKRQAEGEARKKKADALKWLSDNDWKVNKRILGEWGEADERWLEYLTGRAKARTEIDEAEAILAGGAQ